MSGSPRSEQFDDIYFAVENGLEETKHVFLAGNGLPDRWQGRPDFVIAETGFGTGLNFLAAWECFERTAQPHQKLQFISFEKYPPQCGTDKRVSVRLGRQDGGLSEPAGRTLSLKSDRLAFHPCYRPGVAASYFR